ncbi:hypothetical protein ACVBEH_04060 [Roseateles sp. GG27B]
MDALKAGQRFMPDQPIAHGQVATLDQWQAQMPGQISLLVIGFVGAGRRSTISGGSPGRKGAPPLVDT